MRLLVPLSSIPNHDLKSEGDALGHLSGPEPFDPGPAARVLV